MRDPTVHSWRLAELGFESRQSARSTCSLHFISLCFCRIEDLNFPKLNAHMTQFHPMLMTLGPTVSWSWDSLPPPEDTELPLVRELAEICTQQELDKCLRKEKRNKQERKEVEARKNKRNGISGMESHLLQSLPFSFHRWANWLDFHRVLLHQVF